MNLNAERPDNAAWRETPTLPRFDESRLALLDLLRAHYGLFPTPSTRPSGVDGAAAGAEAGPFERLASVAVGLVAESRVSAAALEALRKAGLLEPAALAEVEPIELEDVLKQARVRVAAKALRPLVKLARWVVATGFDAEQAETRSTEDLREAWRSLNGIGPASVDALLLFALHRPTYPVDRATYRVLVRHGWLDPAADFDEARSVAESLAPDDADALARISPAMERVGRDFCKPTIARCERCPLQVLLPEGGPREIE